MIFFPYSHEITCPWILFVAEMLRDSLRSLPRCQQPFSRPTTVLSLCSPLNVNSLKYSRNNNTLQPTTATDSILVALTTVHISAWKLGRIIWQYIHTRACARGAGNTTFRILIRCRELNLLNNAQRDYKNKHCQKLILTY